MTRLVYDNAAGTDGRGMGQLFASDMRITLATRPPLDVEFDSIDVDTDGGLASKVLGGTTVALSTAEVAKVAAYLAAYGFMNDSHLVWGVDAAGLPLGLVEAGKAFAISPPQPQIGIYRWSFDFATWVPA